MRPTHVRTLATIAKRLFQVNTTITKNFLVELWNFCHMPDYKIFSDNATNLLNKDGAS